jgi:hypothetical protein
MSQLYNNSHLFNDNPKNPFNPDIVYKSKTSKSFQTISEITPPACNLISIDEAPPGALALSESQLSTVSSSSSNQKAHRTDMKFSPEEKETYLQLYTSLLNLTENKEKVSSLSAARLMKSSGLSSDILKAIWLTVVRSDSRQEIRKSEFFACLKLVAIAQKGGTISREMLVKKLTNAELPILDSVAVKPANRSGKENVFITKEMSMDLDIKAVTSSKANEKANLSNVFTHRNHIKYDKAQMISFRDQDGEKVCG